MSRAPGAGEAGTLERPPLSRGTASAALPASIEDLVRRTRLVAFDFDGVFTDNLVYVFENGMEAVRCTRADGLGLRKLERLGIAPVIISTEVNPVVQARSRKLQVPCVSGCEDKRAALDAILAERGLTLEQAAFVGNDVNDLPCLAAVGFPIVVADSHADVAPYAQYRTQTPGGKGAVREVCDLFARVLDGSLALAAAPRCPDSARARASDHRATQIL